MKLLPSIPTLLYVARIWTVTATDMSDCVSLQNMKAEADRMAVQHADMLEEMSTKQSKELEDAG